MVLNEFLIALGIQDNFSGKFKEITDKADKESSGAAKRIAKNFVLSTAMIGTALTAAGVGVYKFANSLVEGEENVKALSKELGISRNEAWSTNKALTSMGKTMEEVEANPELLKQFKALKAEAKEIQPPDITPYLSTFKGLMGDITSLKQTATTALEWIGISFFKNAEKPLQDIRGYIQSIREFIVKNMASISEKIGSAMSYMVRLINTAFKVIHKAWLIFAKVLDMIPGKIKLIGGAIGALSKIMSMGPLGIITAIIVGLLVLLDDLFTYLEGGEALLGGLWEPLINLFKGIEDSGGGVLDFILALIPNLLDALGSLLDWVIDAIVEYLPVLLETATNLFLGLVDGIVKAAPSIMEALAKLITQLLTSLLKALPKVLNAGLKMILELAKGIFKALPAAINAIVQLVTTLLDELIAHLPELLDAGWNLLKEIVQGILDALPELIAAIPEIIEALGTGIQAINGKIREIGKTIVEKLWEGIKSMGSWLGEKVSGFIGDAVGGIKDFFTGGGGENNDGGGGSSGGHANGGIFSEEHTARFAEGNQPEAIVPLTKPSRAAEVLQGISNYFGVDQSNNSNFDLSAIISSIQSVNDTIMSATNQIASALTMPELSVAGGNSTINNYYNDNRTIPMNITCQGASEIAPATAKTIGNQSLNMIKSISNPII